MAIAIPGSLLTLAGYPAQARITSLGALGSLCAYLVVVAPLLITNRMKAIAAAGNPAGSELVVKDRLLDTLQGATIALTILLLSKHFTPSRTQQQPDDPRCL